MTDRIVFYFRLLVFWSFVLIVSALAAQQVSAQNNDYVTITGTVLNADTGEPLAGANVFIKDSFLGASTDANGRYKIQRVPAGEVMLKASYIGFESVTKELVFNPEKTIQVSFELSPVAIQTEQIIVTGSRQPEELASAASSVNVLNRKDIQRRNEFTIDQALHSVPGVTMVGENINIRGGSGYNRLGGNRTLVLLDEVPIMTSDMGNANWNILPITEVEHIEVLKGAASSLYGSGAISGVVNIITQKPAQEPSLSFRHASGIYDQPSVPQWKWTNKTLHLHRTDLSYSNTYGPVGVRVAFSHHQSTGDRQNGWFRRWYMTGKAVAQLSGQSTLTLFSTYSSEERELFLQWREQDQALKVPKPDIGDQVALDGFVGYAVYHKLFSPTLSTKARVSYNQQLVGMPFNITGAFTPAIGLSGEWQVNWKPHPQHSLSGGLNYKYDTVESKFYGNQNAHGLSPFIHEIWKLSDLVQLNAGLRYDNYILVGDSLETQWSPRFGFSYQPVNGTVFHGSAGRGFRAATVVERFIDAGSRDFRAKPNPTLRPERSSLFDLGVRQSIGNTMYAEITGFYNFYTDLIEPTLSTDLTARFVNKPKARIRGVEAQWRWRVWNDRLSLFASATYMDPEEIDSGKTLPYRPRWTGYISPTFSIADFDVGADYRYMSRLERVSIYPNDERVPTKVLDLRLGYKWQPLNVQFIIRNALNYNYTVSERVLGKIRHFIFSVRGSF